MKTENKAGIRLTENNGALLDGDVRYLLIRADSLMGMIRNLVAEDQQKILNALSDSVSVSGGKSIIRYQNMGDSSSDKLIKKVVHTSTQLGWGKWSFHNKDSDSIELEVSNSPFAAGFGRSEFPVCAPITGMLKTIAEVITKKQVIVEELRCSAMGEDTCLFHAQTIS